MKRLSLFCAVVGLAIANAVSAQSNPSMMKAIVVHEYGGPDVLKYEDVPRPEPKDDEILIRTMAAGVNPVDAAIRAGRFRSGQLPFIPGMDVAGVVEKVGAKVTKFKTGDPVYAYLSFTGAGRLRRVHHREGK